jgi:WhiB family redox-sensing transcriptional regulator
MRLPELNTTHTPHTPDWRVRAACRDVDPEIFFPIAAERGASSRHPDVRPAVTICRRCPVEGACLRWAVDTGQRWGVWGGRTPSERTGRALATCQQCGALFAPRRPSQRYCGRGCQRASLRDQPPAGPCGSPAGARRHRLRGEPVDPLCRLAETLAADQPERTRS